MVPEPPANVAPARPAVDSLCSVRPPTGFVGPTGYSEARVENQHVKTTILAHGDFALYRRRVSEICDSWGDTHQPLLKATRTEANPKDFIHDL